MTQDYFLNRQDAGEQLARHLLKYRGQPTVVLALPRGGVPVGLAVAIALEAPLDLVLVRKIGAPHQPEFAIGAVVDGPEPFTVINEEAVRLLDVPEDYVRAETERQLEEIERRREKYLAGRPRATVEGKTAIVVDDGIATGATVRAGLQAVRSAKPAKLVLATPVAPPDAVETLRQEVDELVCLLTPDYLGAISQFYLDFGQVEDSDVIELLNRIGGREEGEPAPKNPGKAEALSGTRTGRSRPLSSDAR